MTSRPDPDPVISAWLNDEAAERAPERLLSAARDRVQSTHQRRAWWPAWRLQSMNNRVLGGAVAAIAVIVVLGIVFLPKPSGSGGPPLQSPVPSASPSPSPSPALSSTPSSSPAVISPGQICSTGIPCVTGTLEAGTYSFAGGSVTPTNLTFTVPAGWTTDSGYVSKNALTIQNDLEHPGPHEVFFATFPITNVFSDACHPNTMVSAGTTVDQLTSLLVAQKGGRVASAPTNVTLGGFPAKRIQFTVPATVGVETCDNGVGLLHFWPDPDGTSNGGICCSSVGSTDVVYVLHIAGEQFVVMTRQAAGATPADLAELNAIVASVKIAKSPASPAPSGASPSP
jgi:hypothetical protein